MSIKTGKMRLNRFHKQPRSLSDTSSLEAYLRKQLRYLNEQFNCQHREDTLKLKYFVRISNRAFMQQPIVYINFELLAGFPFLIITMLSLTAFLKRTKVDTCI